MDETKEFPKNLPTARQIRQAVDLYILHAYGNDVPATIQSFIPPENFQPHVWLMSDPVERVGSDSDVPVGEVKSFALRLGNCMYPHMKLRLSLLPDQSAYVFLVDAHDAILSAPPGSPDHDALEQLKKHNAQVTKEISDAFDSAGLPTERNYLREKIKQAREKTKGVGNDERQVRGERLE